MDGLDSNKTSPGNSSEYETSILPETRRITIEELDQLVGWDIDHIITASNNLQSALGVNLTPIPLAVTETHFAIGAHDAPFRAIRGLPSSNSRYWGSPVQVKPTRFDFVDHRFDSLTEDEKDAVRILAGHVYVDEEPGQQMLKPDLTGDERDADRVRDLLWSKRRESPVCPENLSIFYEPLKEPKKIVEAKDLGLEFPRSPSGRPIYQVFVPPKYPVNPDQIFRQIISPQQRLRQTRSYRISENRHSCRNTETLPESLWSKSYSSESSQLETSNHTVPKNVRTSTEADTQVCIDTVPSLRQQSSCSYSHNLHTSID
jgi:hypothetical protein